MDNKKELKKGLYIQIYRDKIPGKTKQEKIKNLCEKLDLFKSLGITGIVWHGFVGDLDTKKFLELTKLCQDRGLLSLAAYGLGSLNAKKSGIWMGQVASNPECFSLVIDAEGAWENQESDKQSAIDMGIEIRKLAPNVLIMDQSWWLPTVHWSMFPWEEFNEYVDINAPQVYCNNYKKQHGKNAYEITFEKHKKAWEKLDERLVKKNLVKPRIKTIQGYYWDLNDLVNCLTTYDTLIVWSEPYPDDNFIKGIQIKNKLESLGFSGPNAVKNFQLSTNGKLVADNICGPLTQKELGF